MPRRWSPAAGHAALLLLGALLLPARASAQTTALTLTGSVSIPSGAAIDSTDYNAGWVCATGSVTYTAQATTGNTARVVTVALRSSGGITVTPGGTKALADLEYRVGTACSPSVAGTGWTPLALSDATIASGSIRANGPAAGRRLTGTVYFRLRLNWATDLGGDTYTLPQLIFTVSQ